MFFLEPIEAFIWTKNQPIQAFNIIGGTAAANKGLTCVTLLGHLFYSVQLWLKLGNGTQMLKAYGRPGNSFREKHTFSCFLPGWRQPCSCCGWSTMQ